MALASGQAIADPFVPTAEIVALLELRVEQLRAERERAARPRWPDALAAAAQPVARARLKPAQLGPLAGHASSEVVPGVLRLGTPFVSWYLVAGDGGVTAVDAGLPGYADSLEQDLSRVGFGLGDIRAVVLTHSDADHTGMAGRLRDAGARVLIGAGDEPTLAKPRAKSGDAAPVKLARELWRPNLWRFMGHMARAGGARPSPVEGAETFADGDVLEVPGRPRAIATPGHTIGHSAFLFEQHGALFVGDALCTWNPSTGSRWPQLMPRPMNEDNGSARASLDAIAAVEAQVLLCGHGEPWHGAPAAAVERARGVR